MHHVHVHDCQPAPYTPPLPLIPSHLASAALLLVCSVDSGVGFVSFLSILLGRLSRKLLLPRHNSPCRSYRHNRPSPTTDLALPTYTSLSGHQY